DRVGYGSAQLHDIGMLVVAPGALQRPDVELLRGQHLAARRVDARRWTDLEAQQACQSAHLDRFAERHGDLSEIGDALGMIRRARRYWRRQEWNKARAVSFRGDHDPLKGFPSICWTEL